MAPMDFAFRTLIALETHASVRPTPVNERELPAFNTVARLVLPPREARRQPNIIPRPSLLKISTSYCIQASPNLRR